MGKEVLFYYDYADPYSYLASTQLSKISSVAGVIFRWKPVLQSELFSSIGQPYPFGPVKEQYIQDDLTRLSSFYNVPICFPKTFPIDSSMALRGGIIAHYRGVGSVYDSRAFSMYWREGKNLSHKKYLLELSRISGLEPQEFMDAINDDTIMNKLNENIKTATHHGVFDVPTFVVEEQLFWGIDRLNFLASFIKKN